MKRLAYSTMCVCLRSFTVRSNRRCPQFLHRQTWHTQFTHTLPGRLQRAATVWNITAICINLIPFRTPSMTYMGTELAWLMSFKVCIALHKTQCQSYLVSYDITQCICQRRQVEVNTPGFNLSQAGGYSIYLPQRKWKAEMMVYFTCPQSHPPK